MKLPFDTMLRGVSGEYEVNRVIGAFGALAYVACANGFEAYRIFWLKQPFDITAYCLAFPTGLGVAVGAIAGAARIKDQATEKARVINQGEPQ